MAATKVTTDRGGTKIKAKARSKSVKENAAAATAATGANGKRRAPRSKGPAVKMSRKVTPEQHRHMIAEAAYYRAERRGFQCRCSEQDWFDAAAEIDTILNGR